MPELNRKPIGGIFKAPEIPIRVGEGVQMLGPIITEEMMADITGTLTKRLDNKVNSENFDEFARSFGVEPEKYDMVDKPQHYHHSGIDPWTVMQKMFGLEFNEGFLVGSAIKYVLRYQHKGGLEDIRKAIRNLQEYVDLKEGGEK